MGAPYNDAGRSLRYGLLLVAVVGVCLGCPAAADDSESSSGFSRRVVEEEEEVQELWEQLTEREDKNRLEEPLTAEVFGNLLTISGEYEIELGFGDNLGIGDPEDDFDALLLEHEIEAEVFYTLGEAFSVFVQFKLAMEEDLDDSVPDQVSDRYFEREEMWIYSEDILGSGLSVEVGRLDFEDDRRWWWDEELDAIRIAWENDEAEVTLAVAREMGPSRSDRGYVEPENDRVLRLIAEISWDYAPNQAFQLFALYQEDHSPTGELGERVSAKREDESDATLTWVGARVEGAFERERAGIFGYWLDVAGVWGHETLVEYEERNSRISVVDEFHTRDVAGWGLDVGSTWVLPVGYAPRLTLGYAVGSGERRPEDGDDHSFRQTGLQSDEPGFGGVQSFSAYGLLLDPELSNLHVFTAGVGIALLESSSLDFVYHYYRQFDPSTSLRDARLDPELTGKSRDVGHGIDVVLAFEEWKRLELELIGAAFRAGRAFATDRGEWSLGAFARMSMAF